MLEIDVEKTLGEFALKVKYGTDSRRIGILGPSGCGKSMTLKSIAGIEKPDKGYIKVDGKVLFDGEGRINLKPQERNVGYLFQNYALFPSMTVEKNIAAGLKCPKEEKSQRVAQMVRRFRLSGLEKHFPHQLSGGQQQRVALARIMAYEPSVILLDEPFSALDLYLRDALQQELEELLEGYGGVVILVSHNRDEIYRFSEEILVLDRGRCIVSGERGELFANPVYEEAARITGCKNFSDIRKIDDHTFEAVDWGITVRTAGVVPGNAECIGYRAHDFIPIWEECGEGCREESGEGMIPLELLSKACLPFEQNYYFRFPSGKEGRICWFVQREMEEKLKKNGMPRYLKVNEERIIFLRKYKF